MIPYLIYERLNDIVYINASMSVTPPCCSANFGRMHTFLACLYNLSIGGK